MSGNAGDENSTVFTIKETGDFLWDLMLALGYPGRESENPHVRQIFKIVAEPSLMEIVKSLMLEFSQLSIRELIKLCREFKKRVEYALSTECPGEIEHTGYKTHLQVKSLLTFIAAFVELLYRSDSDNNIMPVKVALFHGLRNNDPTWNKVLFVLRKALDQDIEEALVESNEKDIERIAGRLSGLDQADKITLGKIYYEHLTSICEKKLSRLSSEELALIKWEPDNDIRYIPHAVWEKALKTKELTDYSRLQKRKERLKKSTASEEKKEKTRFEIRRDEHELINFKKPQPVGVTDERQDKQDPMPVEYVVPEDPRASRLDVLTKIEIKKEAVRTLEQWRDSRRGNAKTAKSFVRYLLENMDSDEAAFTNREIAKSIGTHEDVVGRLRKRIAKDVPILREILKN